MIALQATGKVRPDARRGTFYFCATELLSPCGFADMIVRPRIAGQEHRCVQLLAQPHRGQREGDWCLARECDAAAC